MPLMKALLRPPTAPLIAVTEFPLDLSVQYLAGGGAPGLPVVLRAQVNPKRVTPPEGFEEFTFANGALTEGIVRRGAGGDDVLDEDDPGEGAEGASRARSGGALLIHQREALVLDAAGTARATIKGLAEAATPQDVLAELEFRDPSGETQTVSTRVPLWPAAYLVGLKPEGWAASRERLKGQVAVVDVRGAPVAGAPVEVDVFARTFYSYRKRLVGGFTKTLMPIETRAPAGSGTWSRGNLVRVRLEVEAQSDMTWVVVDDPIPAGASHLGTGLARQSRIATEGEQGRRRIWPAYEEKSFESFRAYYAYVPKGSFTVEYTVRLNQGGRFELPATRVEALYAPEMFGELPNRPLAVAP